MTFPRALLTAGVATLSATSLLAQAPARAAATPADSLISAREIDAHLRFLSSDLLEGRAPATRGGRLAAEYIASRLLAAGVEPGNDGSYFQSVPIDIVNADPKTISVRASGKATANFAYPDQVVVWAGSAADSSVARGELVFVGYGVDAPEYKWNDFKGMDLKGKVLLVLVNDPPATSREPNLFGANAMTYYGRWTYKFEEAERQGAAGALIVHTTERAGYPWHTVVGSWAKEQRMLPRDKSAPPPIGVQGWITDSAATALLAQAGLDLAKLRTQAESRDFKPVPTGITIDASFTNSVQHLQSENVVGIVRGSDPALRDEHVALTAHWDHLGIGPKVGDDSIYNGASDNASGVADMLAVAQAAARSAHPSRSMLFVFVTAEESGLLGSQYYAMNPTVPIAKVVANINVDGGNVLGRTNDLRVLGEDKSSLGNTLRQVIRSDGMRITPDEHPERGYFYRSDHFSFAKAGVPSVSVGAGTDFIGRPKGWGSERLQDYTDHRYHQPSDEYRPDWDLSGAVQLSNIVLRLGLTVANSKDVPTWSPNAEFKRTTAN